MKFAVRGLASLCLFASVIVPSWAQVTIPQEYGKTIKTAEAVGALGENLFGEEVNFYTGTTTFVANHVSLPGNDALPVSIGRRLVIGSRDRSVALDEETKFGGWDLDIPHLSGIFAASTGWAVQNLIPGQPLGDPNQRCSAGGLGQPPTVSGHTNIGTWYANEYWQGYEMYIPGVGGQEMLRAVATTNPNQPTDGKTYKWLTSGNWYVSCLSATANGYPGEGFLVISPDGVTYWFDWFVSRPAPDITKVWGSVAPELAQQQPVDEAPTPFGPVTQMTLLQRVEVWALPTRVEDRFGNSVTYTYDTAHPWRLSSIQSSDGRVLTIGRNATTGAITSVFDGTRSWTYASTANGFEVTQPDGKKWIYSAQGEAYTEPDTLSSFCGSAFGRPGSQPIYTQTITHPSGAVGTFRFQSRQHGRSYVQKICVKPDPNNASDYAKYPLLFDAISILDKTITGTGLPTLTWTYTYGATNHSWLENCANDSCAATKTVEVTGPGSWSRYTFSNRWNHSEGKLLKTETGSGPTGILRTETTTYLLDPTGQNYPDVMGPNPFDRADNTAEILTPVIKREITQQGQRFTWEVDQTGGVYDFDIFGRPTKITRSSAPSP